MPSRLVKEKLLKKQSISVKACKIAPTSYEEDKISLKAYN